jgi:carboxyl-terminal processing protease
LAFFGGYVFGQVDAVSGTRPVIGVLRSISTALHLAPGPLATADGALDPAQAQKFKVFWEAWNLLKGEFYNRSRVDDTALTYGAVKGLVDSVDDPHTRFSPPAEFKASQDQLEGHFDGIGVQIDLKDDHIRVVAPLDGSPAEQAGIRTNDIIVAVDGQPLTAPDLDQAVKLIRGQRGTPVKITVRREGVADPLTFEIVRSEIKMEVVKSRMEGTDIGYLRIASFTAQSGVETANALRSLMDKQPRGIVLDLRSNPGGYLTAAVDISSQFLSDGVVVYQQYADGRQDELRVKPGGVATSVPVAILVNKGSASASEIVAGALRDSGRAVLVGEQTFGKGSVQTVHRLSDGSGMRLTTAVWLTPNKSGIDKTGLAPDIPLALEPGQRITPESDPQLQAAVTYLHSSAAAALRPGGNG